MRPPRPTRQRVDPHGFVEALRPALRQAAAITRALEGNVANEPKQGEDTPAKAALTLADIASQEAILVRLHECFPDVALEAEEQTPGAALFARAGEPLVVLDPLDGTWHSYLHHRGPYGVILGLAHGGRFDAALVALPREGLFFDAVRGGPVNAWHAAGDLRPARLRGEGRRVLVSHELPDRARGRLAAAGYEPVSAAGAAIGVAPLIPGVCGGLRVATSSAGVSIRGRAAAFVARVAGAIVACEHGPLPEAIDAPARTLYVASDEARLRDFRAAMAA